MAKKTSLDWHHRSQLVSVIIVITAVSIGVVSYFHSNHSKQCASRNEVRVWPIVSNQQSQPDQLRTVQLISEMNGHRIVNGSNEGWDVMWSVDFPFEKFPAELDTLKPHQLINHFPGMTFLTNKMHLAIATQSKYIPIAFEFPHLKNEFLYYQKMNLKKKFVVKNVDSRGVKVVEFNDMDFVLDQQRFVQEFIPNPYLIDGHAFDVGVYVLITSIEPLRIYRWKRDILLRFCPEPFHPFHPETVDRYVVSETHLPFWEMPSLENASEIFGFSAIDSLNFHLKDMGQDVDTLWEQIDDAIITITLSKATQINRHVNFFQKGRSEAVPKHFELLRFDFLLDGALDVHLMEVNMSPVLSDDKSERLNLMYKQLVYNTMTIVGISKPSEIKPSSIEESLMFSAAKDIAVQPENCANCVDSCDNNLCELCLPCMSVNTTKSFHQAYREHQRRGEMSRIFPNENCMQERLMKTFSDQNKLAVKWFKAKCDEDFEWC